MRTLLSFVIRHSLFIMLLTASFIAQAQLNAPILSGAPRGGGGGGSCVCDECGVWPQIDSIYGKPDNDSAFFRCNGIEYPVYVSEEGGGPPPRYVDSIWCDNDSIFYIKDDQTINVGSCGAGGDTSLWTYSSNTLVNKRTHEIEFAVITELGGDTTGVIINPDPGSVSLFIAQNLAIKFTGTQMGNAADDAWFKFDGSDIEIGAFLDTSQDINILAGGGVGISGDTIDMTGDIVQIFASDSSYYSSPKIYINGSDHTHINGNDSLKLASSLSIQLQVSSGVIEIENILSIADTAGLNQVVYIDSTGLNGRWGLFYKLD